MSSIGKAPDLGEVRGDHGCRNDETDRHREARTGPRLGIIKRYLAVAPRARHEEAVADPTCSYDRERKPRKHEEVGSDAFADQAVGLDGSKEQSGSDNGNEEPRDAAQPGEKGDVALVPGPGQPLFGPAINSPAQ